MAKKEETISLIDTFSEFKELKNIDRTTMVSVLEESFRSVIAKMFGTDENYDVIVNPDKGDFEIWRNREVVADEDLENPNLQISLSEARKIDVSYEVGEEVTDEVNFAKFGRRAILNLRQTLASKILELEKDSIYNKYIDKVGTIINAEVYQIWKKEMLLLDDEGNELLLPKTEQIPSDFYRKGETARAVVARVDNKNNNPKIILSRTSPVFLQRLFEMEVPEINDGLITIKKIARIPGERAKVAVESYDERIDPVGACVGMKGSRIYSIVKELRNENIDVVNYTTNPQLMIQRALNPAEDFEHHHRRGEEDSFGLSQARPGIAGHRQGRPEHPPLEDAHRLRHRRLPRDRGGGRGPHGVRRRDRRLDHRRAEERRLRHGQERAGAARRGDRRPRRPRTGAGAEGRRDSEGRVRITKTERKENNTIWVMKEN